ncbi:hypothetical protein CR513_00512, partial [Mucuna pruriens]
MVVKVCGICTSVEHRTDMCPTLQEIESDQPKNVGAIGGFQYGKQSYQNRPFDSQQHGRQPFQPRSNQGPYETQQFGSTPNAYQRQAGYQQPTQQYQVPPFQQQQQQRRYLLKLPRSVEADSKSNANSQSRQDKTVLMPFPTRTISARKPKSNEKLLKMFRKVEINIPLLDSIKQISKYVKFLKELCVHKRKKMKGSTKIGSVVSALTRNENFTKGAQALPKKCRDPRIFSVPCTIGACTFADAMLDLGASINVMHISIYKALSFDDLEPTGMTIQLANRSIVQPLGVLEDVLV